MKKSEIFHDIFFLFISVICVGITTQAFLECRQWRRRDLCFTALEWFAKIEKFEKRLSPNKSHVRIKCSANIVPNHNLIVVTMTMHSIQSSWRHFRAEKKKSFGIQSSQKFMFIGSTKFAFVFILFFRIWSTLKYLLHWNWASGNMENFFLLLFLVSPVCVKSQKSSGLWWLPFNCIGLNRKKKLFLWKKIIHF